MMQYVIGRGAHVRDVVSRGAPIARITKYNRIISVTGSLYEPLQAHSLNLFSSSRLPRCLTLLASSVSVHPS